MKLSDWPLEPDTDGGEYVCLHPVEVEHGARACLVEIEVMAPGSNMVHTPQTLGELVGAIVAHARDQHGIEIERDGVWYESFTPDGKLWAGSSSVDDFTAADLDGMEGEELEHWTAQNAKMAELRYHRIGVYTVTFAEEWKP